MTIKLAFIGTGGIAQHHMNTIAQIEGVTISAFCDIDMIRAEQAASKWNGAKAFSNIDEMLDTAKPDGVYICVPPMAHGDAERKVIGRGLPFFVEKPLGIDSSIPSELLHEVRSKGIITGAGYHWRYQDSTKKAQEILQSCKPGMALGYWMGGMPMVPWWRLQQGSGGQFVEQTTHIVDLLRYLCGDVKEVYAAYALRVMHEKVDGTEVPDVGTVTLKLANGMVATISNTCLIPIEHRIGLDIYSDRGVLEIRGDMLRDLSTKEAAEFKGASNATRSEDEAFIHAIRTGDTSRILCDYAEAYKTHEVTIAANKSAQTGKTIILT